LSAETLPETNPRVVLREALEAFCDRTQWELVSARVDGADAATRAMLIAAGFLPVDFSLLARIHPLKPLPEHRHPDDEADRPDLARTSLGVEE
jgi:hypothetical protein